MVGFARAAPGRGSRRRRGGFVEGPEEGRGGERAERRERSGIASHRRDDPGSSALTLERGVLTLERGVLTLEPRGVFTLRAAAGHIRALVRGARAAEGRASRRKRRAMGMGGAPLASASCSCSCP